jgi:carboxypeptidase C (cathepsin A)
MKIKARKDSRAAFITEHEITLRGETVRYRAIAEETAVEDDMGKPLASLFTYTYLRTGAGNCVKRPVIFAFNGGPGSSSAWLHLGLFGPRRVSLSDDVNPEVLPPYELEDNPHCLLDTCDLVMIDPVNTGYARLYQEGAQSQFYGVRQDAGVLALFIESWLNRYDRQMSPRFVAGESYGTIRACMLLRELMGGPMTENHRLLAIPVNGVILLGSALTLQVLGAAPAVYPEVLKLMAQAAVHHYHHPDGKPGVADFAEEAWHFAGGDYLQALFAGEALDAEKRRKLCGKLEYFTGVSAEWFDGHNLKVDDVSFRSLVLREIGLDVGSYDGRYTMTHTELLPVCDPVGDDPAMGKYTPAFSGAMNTVIRSELGITLDREYRAIDFAVNGKWDYSSPVSPAEALTAAMRRNEKMRVFFVSGLYDLVTHPGEVRYLTAHLNLPKDKVTVREYESGHMPYIGKESAEKLEADLRAFIRQAV